MVRRCTGRIGVGCAHRVHTSTPRYAFSGLLCTITTLHGRKWHNRQGPNHDSLHISRHKGHVGGGKPCTQTQSTVVSPRRWRFSRGSSSGPIRCCWHCRPRQGYASSGCKLCRDGGRENNEISTCQMTFLPMHHSLER